MISRNRVVKWAENQIVLVAKLRSPFQIQIALVAKLRSHFQNQIAIAKLRLRKVAKLQLRKVAKNCHFLILNLKITQKPEFCNEWI